MAIYPDHDQIQEFLDGPADREVVMLNLLSFKEQADPPFEGMTGAEVVMRYSTAMKEFVERHGASFVLAGTVDSQLIGHSDDPYGFVALMRYPSRQTYLELAADPEIAATIGKYREAGLKSQLLFAISEIES